jgi:hypothetical protein
MAVAVEHTSSTSQQVICDKSGHASPGQGLGAPSRYSQARHSKHMTHWVYVSDHNAKSSTNEKKK